MLLLALLCLKICPAQDSSGALLQVPGKLYENVSNNNKKAADKLYQQQEKMLKKAQASEEKIYKKLKKIDSTKAVAFYNGITEKYQALQKKLNDPASLVESGKAGQYIPRIDSLKTMLTFLGPLSKSKEDVDKAVANIDVLKGRLTQADDVKSFLAEREAALRNLTQLSAKLPADLSKNIGKYSKELYYYNERIKGLKEDLKDPKKIEQTALLLLNKIRAFRDFFAQNGELGRLFGQPGGNLTNEVVTGLQTRNAVQQLISQQVGQAGNPMQLIQQQMQTAQGSISQLQNNLLMLANGQKSNGDLKEFKPNPEAGRPFLKRLDYDINLQTGSLLNRSVSGGGINDFCISVGYRVNKRLTAGVGLAYKFGLGNGWKHLAFTHEGIGFRSWVDYKIASPEKGPKVLFSSLWITAGYEQNYFTAFKNVSDLKGLWKSSALVGISKKIQYQKRTCKMSLLWDFTDYKTTEKPTLLWRVGWSL